MTTPFHVAGAVCFRGEFVMAAQRGPGKAMAGYWEFPGGKIEPGETPQEALARELREELEVEATIGALITTTEYEYDFGVVMLSTFACTLLGDEPVLKEHQAIRWLHPHDLHTLQWAPADIPTVRLIQQRYTANTGQEQG